MKCYFCGKELLVKDSSSNYPTGEGENGLVEVVDVCQKCMLDRKNLTDYQKKLLLDRN